MAVKFVEAFEIIVDGLTYGPYRMDQREKFKSLIGLKGVKERRFQVDEKLLPLPPTVKVTEGDNACLF